MTAHQEDTQATPIKERSLKKLIVILLAVLGGILLLGIGSAAGGYYYFQQQYNFKVYPGITVGDINISGLTYLEALDTVERQIEVLEQDPITVELSGIETETGSDSVDLPPFLIPTESSGNDRILYYYDAKTSVDAAYAIGRESDWQTNIKQQWWAWRNGRTIQPELVVDADVIEELLYSTFEEYELPAEDAQMALDENGELTITEEKNGLSFEYETVSEQIVSQLQQMDNGDITTTLTTTAPEFTTADIESERNNIQHLLSQAPITLTWKENDDAEIKEWQYDATAFGQWLMYEDGSLTVDQEKLAEAITEPLTTIEIEPQEARWKVMTNDEGVLTEIIELTPIVVGRTVDTAATASTITEWITAELDSIQTVSTDSEETETPRFAITITEKQPEVNTENVNDLGITDLLGTGHSDMAGSPYNRTVNIDRGIELLNGLLIAPGETFSLLETLKPFTLSNGYVAELVIKGNETIPEIGGGLCQIGSTTFRAAMESGLDIIERRNHSYAVSYYFDDRNNLPGTDATIYDSSPDFKFLNDTEAPILVQARRDGTMLYFDFWGKSDGRNGYFTAPTISGWVSPPATKYVETTELAPGQTRCTESAHAGTTASFDYIIERPDGEDHLETFTSVYRPWQAVCLVGKQPEETPAQEEPAETVEEETPEETTEKKSDEKKKKKD